MEYVYNSDELLAIIIKRDFSVKGVRFFTPDNFSQQLAYMSHSAGKVIDPHIHNPVTREVKCTAVKECHRMRYLFIPEIRSLFASHGMQPAFFAEWLTSREPGFDTWNICAGGRVIN
jgi:hypothetical protein